MSPINLKLLNYVLRKLTSQRKSPHQKYLPLLDYPCFLHCYHNLLDQEKYLLLTEKKRIPSYKAVSCKDIQVYRHVLKSLPICKSNMYIFLVHTYPKHQNFPSQSISRKRPPLLHKHPQPLFRLMFCSSQLILTSSKWSLEAWCGLFVHWMFYAAQSVRWTFMAL